MHSDKTVRLVALAVICVAAPGLWAQATAEDTGGSAARKAEIAETGNETRGFDMAPETRLEVVEAAVREIPVKLPEGKWKPTWESLQDHYRVPDWFYDAKFGIFMHWGLYSVPAYKSEWYEKHMYGNAGILGWHTEHFGPPEKFGYKDFIPLFTQDKFDPDSWADLFRKAGARYVVPTAQHHDNFALWDSDVTPINARQMGPKRDLIGDLATAVRAKGMKFGVSNHGIENFQFINPPKDLAEKLKAAQADLYDPKWVNFYHVADRSDAACKKFLVDWVLRNVELIDKYQPDMLWFDNGVDMRYLDPLKLWIAAYYYNRADQWGKAVSISTKKAAYAPGGTNVHTIGSIVDFEKIGARSPGGIRTGAWQVDHPIGSTWGYTEGMKVANAASIVNALVDTASKGGNLLLNLSPTKDGRIPDDQQATLLDVGKWLEVNGDAIYGTHAWTKPADARGREPGSNIKFTVKGDSLYAIVVGEPKAGTVTIKSVGSAAGKVTAVTVLGGAATPFEQDAAGLKVTLPPTAPSKYAIALKISGATVNDTTWTPDGNPRP